jgi:hypothetical protein
MMSSKQYIPDNRHQGMWITNPSYTGNKYVLFQKYDAVLLKPFHNGKLKVGSKCSVSRVPNGNLYLEEWDGCFCMDAKENIDFKLVP